MHKKLIMSCMAVIAFCAFVVAPVASAAPVLTQGAKALGAGAFVKATTTGNAEFTGGIGLVCSHGEMTGTLKENTGTKIKGEVAKENPKFTGTGAGGVCTSLLGDATVKVTSKLCFETLTGSDKVLISGCGEVITFDFTVGLMTCRYDGAGVTGIFKTNAEATINVENQTLTQEEPKEPLCPETGTLKMDVDLTTADGTKLTIS
ncbi:MAG: hypothetical protein ACTHKT_05660 [Solirubrobacterales bacterium]